MKNKIAFPKYTREENRACKLTDNQILEIKSRRETGESYALIAKDFNVTPQTIFYWCLDEQERKRRQKERQEMRELSGYIPPNPIDFTQYRKRKKELHPELKEYENQFTVEVKKSTRPNYIQCRKAEGQRYWKKNKEKLTIKNKEYQLSHLDKFKESSKKWREKNLERVRMLAKESYIRNREHKLAHSREMYRKKRLSQQMLL